MDNLNGLLTGDGRKDKKVVHDYIRQQSELLGYKFYSRYTERGRKFIEAGDNTHFFIVITKGKRHLDSVILSSANRKGSDIWLNITRETYDFFKSLNDDDEYGVKPLVIIVDSKEKHVIYAPFGLLEPGMRFRKIIGIDNCDFHVLDRQSQFAQYTVKWSKKNL